VKEGGRFPRKGEGGKNCSNKGQVVFLGRVVQGKRKALPSKKEKKKRNHSSAEPAKKRKDGLHRTKGIKRQ